MPPILVLRVIVPSIELLMEPDAVNVQPVILSIPLLVSVRQQLSAPVQPDTKMSQALALRSVEMVSCMNWPVMMETKSMEMAATKSVKFRLTLFVRMAQQLHHPSAATTSH